MVLKSSCCTASSGQQGFYETGMGLGLDQVEGKAGDLVCEVAGDGLAVLHDLAVQIELHAALRQVVDGTVHVVAADGDVAMGAAAALR